MFFKSFSYSFLILFFTLSFSSENISNSQHRQLTYAIEACDVHAIENIMKSFVPKKEHLEQTTQMISEFQNVRKINSFNILLAGGCTLLCGINALYSPSLEADDHLFSSKFTHFYTLLICFGGAVKVKNVCQDRLKTLETIHNLLNQKPKDQ